MPASILTSGPARHHRRSGGRTLTFILIAGSAALVAAPIAFMVWPRAAPVALDAPSMPITVGGVTFNVPPAAIRVAVQRRPGTQGRLDLAFLWPRLTPPDPKAKSTPDDPGLRAPRIHLTIAATDGALPPLERLKVIYPRYAPVASAPANGLVRVPFRANSPYHGEELVYDPAAPERFLLRCTAPVKDTPGACLHERRVGGADLTVRFPTEWLANWRDVSSGIDRLIASLRPAGA